MSLRLSRTSAPLTYGYVPRYFDSKSFPGFAGQKLQGTRFSSAFLRRKHRPSIQGAVDTPTLNFNKFLPRTVRSPPFQRSSQGTLQNHSVDLRPRFASQSPVVPAVALEGHSNEGGDDDMDEEGADPYSDRERFAKRQQSLLHLPVGNIVSQRRLSICTPGNS